MIATRRTLAILKRRQQQEKQALPATTERQQAHQQLQIAETVIMSATIVVCR